MKRDVVKKIVFGLVLGVFFGIQPVNAQIVDDKNKVEYMSDDSDVDDLNSLSSSSIKKVTGVPVKRKKKKTHAKESDISMDDLQKIANLRFRKKRGIGLGKCLKEAEKECNSIEEKKKQLARRKK